MTMNMWYKSTIALFTGLLCMESVQDQCNVVQPPQAHVTSVGSSVTLGCRFQIPASATQFRITWLSSFDPHLGCNRLEEFFSSIVHPRQGDKITPDPEGRILLVIGNSSCELTLSRVERRDIGMYFCQVTVEIPSLLRCCGNGTWLDIETQWAPEKGVYEEWWIWLTVGLGAITVASSMLGFFILRRRRREEATPIYVNVGPRPSRSATAVTPCPRTQPRCQHRPAQPKALEALSVPKRPHDNNSLKTQGWVTN